MVINKVLFKDFEIRPYKDLGGVIDTKRFELVKWYEPGRCYVVAFLEWNPKEPCWELQPVGLRLMRDWVEGLDKWILAWCEMATVCMEKDDDE